MAGSAAAITRLTHTDVAARQAQALDVALSDYERRYGDVRFHVTGMHVTERGIEFTVAPR